MKKNAWTLIEMVVAIIIILMLSGLVVNMFKPEAQKAKFYLYATVRNITKGNITIMEKDKSLHKEDLVGTNDWFCVHFADAFNLENAPNCTRGSSSPDMNPNIQFPNGVLIYGLASAWEVPYDNAQFEYKNIMVDINGSSGPNRIWADRFPLRIINGEGYNTQGAEGLVMPVDCGETQIFNANKVAVNIRQAAKNPYCTDNTNYTKDDQMFTYDIYRSEDDSEDSKAKFIAGMLSPLDADCQAYGLNTGYYSTLECAGIKVRPECIRNEACKRCTSETSSMCPGTANSEASCLAIREANNPHNLGCATILHKPSGGMSFILQALIGDIDEI